MNREAQPKHASDTGGRVIIVEDEEALRVAYERLLSAAGLSVYSFGTAEEALAHLESESADALVSDINLPGISGIDLLHEIRKRDLDLPVLVISGSPSVDTAAKAVEWGALRYLVKPVDHVTLRDAVRTAVSLGRISKLQDEAARLSRTTFLRVRDLAGAEATFNAGMQKLWMAYQPIVSLKDRSVVGQEALLRTTSDEIRSPGAFFELAERTGRVRDLGRSIRAAIAGSASQRAPGTDIFVNLHPSDILDPRLYSSDESLLPYAKHVVLEITERDAIKDATGVRERLVYLRKCGFRVAVDDLGSGYSGLNYLALLEPDIVKLDMALTRDVHKIHVKQKLVEAMCTLSHDLGATIVAEGVECAEEQDVLVTLGCDFLQGYLYAKPGKPFPEVTWPG